MLNSNKLKMKRISDKKLEAFSVGTMGKRLPSKKELEERKKKEDEAAAASVFKEYVETFQDAPTPSSKIWVKAGTYDAGSRREDSRDKGKIYKPTSKVDEKSAAEKAQEYAKMLASDLKKDTAIVKKKTQEKKKSNLELFKEELRQIQEEREERHKYKHMTAASASAAAPLPTPAAQPTAAALTDNVGDSRIAGSFDTGDPNTTNLYLANLSPRITEQQLMEIFGRYGPLASIKIMWPRSEEEKARGRHCGFVAYMSRKDAERALETLRGRWIMGYDMRLGWGKSMPIMNQPIYIPPSMLELTIPPPPSGLPFNAQPPVSEIEKLPKMSYKEYTTPEQKEIMEKVLYKSVVKVFTPTEKPVLAVIHRMIEFVVREGPMFEALIMSREICNPLYAFLFENESPAHIYYRWKLFSLLQGDTPTEWREKEFRMFKGGSIWKPPNPNFYTQGMPDELVVDPDALEASKGALSNAQRDRLEYLIRHLTPERSKIGDAMIFCIEHADAADEISECIAESLANLKTLPSKKIARLYLVSDVLHNCAVKVANASFFRKAIERQLLDIFENLHAFFMAFESRLKAEGFKSRVLNVVRAWEDWAVYSKDFLLKLKCTFLGKQMVVQQVADEPTPKANIDDADIDGAPLSGDEKEDEDLDGVPLDGAALLKSALMRSNALTDAMTAQKESLSCQNDDFHDDIDGIPLDDDIDGIPLEKVSANDMAANKASAGGGAFIPSKWETIDPEQVEAQAITTSKWDTLEPPQAPKIYTESSDDDDDKPIDRARDADRDAYEKQQINYDDSDENDNERSGSSVRYDDDLRTKLREIEVKTMHYQDELEAGSRELKSGWSIAEQVEHYRRKLLRKTATTNSNTSSPMSVHQPSNSRKDDRRNVANDDGNEDEDSSVEYRTSSSRSKRSRRSHTPASPRARSGKSGTKRHRSRSNSPLSPTRERYSTSKSSRYGSSLGVDSPSLSSSAYRSPSPTYASSSRSSKRDEREAYASSRSSPSRSRSDKHKHRHKH